MVIAGVLCVNVLWMAFELQLSGADTGYHIGAPWMTYLPNMLQGPGGSVQRISSKFQQPTC